MNALDNVHIPRAEETLSWHKFREENGAFITDKEMTRLEKELDSNGVATHTAHTAGDFVILKVKE